MLTMMMGWGIKHQIPRNDRPCIAWIIIYGQQLLRNPLRIYNLYLRNSIVGLSFCLRTHNLFTDLLTKVLTQSVSNCETLLRRMKNIGFQLKYTRDTAKRTELSVSIGIFVMRASLSLTLILKCCLVSMLSHSHCQP